MERGLCNCLGLTVWVRNVRHSNQGQEATRVVTQVVGGEARCRGNGQTVCDFLSRINTPRWGVRGEGEGPREGETSLIFGLRSHQGTCCWTRVQGLLREPFKRVLCRHRNNKYTDKKSSLMPLIGSCAKLKFIWAAQRPSRPSDARPFFYFSYSPFQL